MKRKVKDFIKKLLPAPLWNSFRDIWLRARRRWKKIHPKIIIHFEVYIVRKTQQRIVKELREKEKLKVIFLVIHHSVWKYEQVYRLLDKDSKFDVEVVVIPLVRAGKGDMDVFNKTFYFFLENNYQVVSSYDPAKDSWLDIKKLTEPDIVFFTNPHKLTFEQYYIYNFLDKLTCYVPYAFVVIHSIWMHYNQDIHHFLWKHFVETKYHANFARKFNKRNLQNIIVTGFPGLDRMFTDDYEPKMVWKTFLEGNAKKIIWAPHHTIEGQESELDYSNFMEYSSFFIEFLRDNQEIQIAFKPHPLLKEKLYKDEQWGKKRTDRYYDQWKLLPNGQIEEGAYLDLFYHSDALILDSASFIVEYLYFDKPILFTMRDESVLERFNSFGKKVFDYLYKARSSSDTIDFINDVVLNNGDVLKYERQRFRKEVILPQNGRTASENIYEQLRKELC